MGGYLFHVAVIDPGIQENSPCPGPQGRIQGLVALLLCGHADTLQTDELEGVNMGSVRNNKVLHMSKCGVRHLFVDYSVVLCVVDPEVVLQGIRIFVIHIGKLEEHVPVVLLAHKVLETYVDGTCV